MRILVDVDDVCVDLLTPWLERYNDDYGDFLKREEITEWDMTKFVDPACGAKIFEYLDDPTIYDNAEQINYAYWAVNRLKEWGHEIVFVTAGANPGKLKWLRDNGFVIPVPGQGKDYISASDKSLIRGDILIDDRPENVKNFPGHAILFDRPHNQNFQWPYRASGWPEALVLVKSIEDDMLRVVVPGLDKNAPLTTNDAGGRQSKLDYRFDLIDPLTLFRLAKILSEGAESHGTWNWRYISINENLNHALTHISAYLAGDGQDDHLGHAFCRLMFALSLELTPGISPRMLPEK